MPTRFTEAGRLVSRDGKVHVWLIVSMCGIALGAMVVAVGVAKLFLHEPPSVSWWLIGVGVVTLTVGIGGVLHGVRGLSEPYDDCERYGRHIVGLTFLLLVIGLCNAVGTSTLAFDGGLGFSAKALLDASDPERMDKEEKNREAKRLAVESRKRELEVAVRKQDRAKALAGKACAPDTTVEGSAPAGCAQATEQAAESEDEVFGATLLVQQAKQDHLDAAQRCERAQLECRRSLFFLLSLSTMMSLFGASFYVVNRVRSKRPRRKHRFAPLDEATPFDEEPESAAPSGATVAIAEAAPNAPAVAVATGQAPSGKHDQAEPFDAHAFWSGGFFRVGEAVLFTFAFFWLIWTSNRRNDVIWLPVLGLFVGMFVKTGEAIIFRLGMRVLSAVEALLPSSLPAPPAAPPTLTLSPTPSTKPNSPTSAADEEPPPTKV